MQLLLDLLQYFQNLYLLKWFCFCILKYIFILTYFNDSIFIEQKCIISCGLFPVSVPVAQW